MDTEKCRALLQAVANGSLTAAAEELGYTVSGLSRMMAGIEQELGFSLLLRSRSGVELTREGQRMLPALRQLVYEDERCRQLAGEIRGLQLGSVIIGNAYSSYYQWLTKLMVGFNRLYPSIDISILDGSSSSLYALLAEHRADFCLVSRRQGDFAWYPLRRDPMVAWVPQDHPLAAKGAFPLSAFSSEAFIETYPHQECDNSLLFSRERIQPHTCFTSGDSYATFSMVAAGLGVSLDNGLTARDWQQDERVRILPLDPPQWVEIGVATVLDLSPAAQAFVAYAQQQWPQAED